MKQRSRQKSVKGYLQIDIAFAILVFFLIFLMAFTLSKDSINAKNELFNTKEIEMNAKDICSILISGPGIPNNWESLTNISKTKIFALKSKTSNSLDINKMNHFNSTNYFTIKNRFDNNSYFNLKIIGMNTSTTHLNFGSNLKGKNVKTSSYNCYSLYNSEPVKLIVEVWK